MLDFKSVPKIYNPSCTVGLHKLILYCLKKNLENKQSFWIFRIGMTMNHGVYQIRYRVTTPYTYLGGVLQTKWSKLTARVLIYVRLINTMYHIMRNFKHWELRGLSIPAMLLILKIYLFPERFVKCPRGLRPEWNILRNKQLRERIAKLKETVKPI